MPAARFMPCTCALPASSPAASSCVAPPPPRLRLDMVVGEKRLRDQFWWDLHAAEPTPEEFAAELCADMGLDACHGASVAAAIRIEVGAGPVLPRWDLQQPVATRSSVCTSDVWCLVWRTLGQRRALPACLLHARNRAQGG